MRTIPRRLAAVLFGTAMSWAAAAQPTITTVHQSSATRSGRVAVEGTGFGAEGVVRIGGLAAAVSTWTDTRVVAYVPEETPLGETDLTVETAGQPSAPAFVTITPRSATGRVLWSFEIDQEQIHYRPALAPDGTLYVHGYSLEGTGEGRVYAVAPDGALRWINRDDVAWAPYVPPAAGPDGAAYVGSINRLYRLGSDGELDWSFESQTIQGGAVVGPDGTVYAGFEQAPEAVALDPTDGSVVWTDSPGLSAFGTGNNESRLGSSTPGGPIDRLYFWWDALYAFTLDGDFLFGTTAGNIYSHEPGIASDGTLYAPGNFESELAAISPFNGAAYWFEEGDWLSGITDVEVGPDDTLYFVSDGRRLEAFDPDMRSSVWRRDPGVRISRPTLTPDGSTLLAYGGGNCDSSGCTVSFIKAFDTANGDELWHLDMNEAWDPEYRNVLWDRPRVSADSRVAYFIGWIAGSHDAADERSLLWAVSLREVEVFSDGFESGDTSAWDSTVN